MSDVNDRMFTSRGIFSCNHDSISWKDSKQSIDGSWVHYRCVGCILVLILVIELDVIPLNIMILYCKDNGTIALAKEPKSHQISKHIEQQNMQLSQVEIHRDAESKLYMRW